jgi:hypothetical protein
MVEIKSGSILLARMRLVQDKLDTPPLAEITVFVKPSKILEESSYLIEKLIELAKRNDA